MGRIQNREQLSTPLVPISEGNPLATAEARLLLVRFLLQGIEVSEQEQITSRLGDKAGVMEMTSSFKALLLEFVTSPDLFEIATIGQVKGSGKDTGISLCLHRRGVPKTSQDIILTRGDYVGEGNHYERLWVDYGESVKGSDGIFVVEPILPSYVTRRRLVNKGSRIHHQAIRSKIVLPDGRDVKAHEAIDDIQFIVLRRLLRQTAQVLSREDSTVSA